jgi:phosphatidylglycerophosphate synthase
LTLVWARHILVSVKDVPSASGISPWFYSDDVFVRSVLRPAVRGLCAWHVHPNTITSVALALSAAVPVLHFRRSAWGAIAAMLAHQVLDCLDGEVARRSGKTSKLGGVLDTVSDSVFLLGLIAILVSAVIRSVPAALACSGLIFAAFFAVHVSRFAGAALLDHAVKTYDTPSLYGRLFAFMANNSLVLVVLFVVLYGLAAR